MAALSPSTVAAPRRTARRASPGLTEMKLGCQTEPSTDEHFAYLARYGVRNVSAKPIIVGDRLYATVDELLALRALGDKHHVAIDMITPPFLKAHHIDMQRHRAIMLGKSPERDREIEAFQTMIRNAALAGIPAIKYNLTLLGVLRTGSVPGRGDARNLVWNLADARANSTITQAGPVDADRHWERITYFLDRVVPVANEYKVRLACHPHDPGVPSSGYQGIMRVLGNVEGLRRFVSIRESQFHGLNFCLGSIAEMLPAPARELNPVIREFGLRKKIFNVHFRNIRGHRDAFEEVFPDEGDIDMVGALRTLADVNYDAMVMPDHVPEVPGDKSATLASFAFAYGYIRGLMQSIEQR